MVVFDKCDEIKTPRTIVEPFFVPPKPCCRRPLQRMTSDEPSPVRTRARYSTSPRGFGSDSYDDESSDDAQLSSDEQDDFDYSGNSVESVSLDYVPECSPITLREDFRQRTSSRPPPDIGIERNQQKSPKTPVNVTYTAKSTRYHETNKNATAYPQRKTDSIPRESPYSERRRSSVSQAKKTGNMFTAGRCFTCVCFFVILYSGIMFNCFSLVASYITVPSNVSKQSDRLMDFRTEIRSIRSKFPSQNNRTWRLIEAGVLDVIKRPQKPWMFVLFSNEATQLERLAEDLGKASRLALGSQSTLSLQPKDFTDDYGDAIDRLRPLIREKKAVVVHDLMNIDPRAIQAFHTMCDRENPLVEEAVYIMTIITSDYAPGSQTPEKFVEDQLTDRFINKVPGDKLQPLITRLMDGTIIPVAAEIN